MVRIQQPKRAFTNAESLRAWTLILKPLEQHTSRSGVVGAQRVMKYSELNSSYSAELDGNLLIL